MAKTFSQASATSWQGLGIRTIRGGPRERYEPQTFEQLKTAYVEKYGYNVTLPGFDDVFKWKPNLLKTKEEIKAEKTRNLQRILASPTPEWYNSYASIMTQIDNVQDTASIVFPTARMLMRWSPRIFSRMLPGLGWVLLGYDMLQLANALGRVWMQPMKAKRAVCQLVRSNPFSKNAQWNRTDRIKKWNPGLADVLQTLQVTADHTGVGLSLGSLVGFIPDLAAGLYRKLKGEKVSFFSELPPFHPHELKAAKGMSAAALINTAGQVFYDEIHMLAYLTFAESVNVITPYIEQADLGGAVEDPGTAIIDAPGPEDPLTIEVIKEAGLNVDRGISWPGTGEKQISLLDLSNLISENSRRSFWDYSIRNAKNYNGYFAAHLMDDAVFDLVDALEPNAEYVADDTPMTRILFTMVKHPIIPDPLPPPELWTKFERWVHDYEAFNERIPSISEIKEKFTALGIGWTTTLPTTPDPDLKKLFPDPLDTSEFA